MKGVEILDGTWSLIFQLVRWLEMIDWVGCVSLKLESSIQHMSLLCHTLSNAISMSKNITRAITFFVKISMDVF